MAMPPSYNYSKPSYNYSKPYDCNPYNSPISSSGASGDIKVKFSVLDPEDPDSYFPRKKIKNKFSLLLFKD